MKEFIRENILFFFTFLFVLLIFSYLFYLSTNYIINYWTFSQAHINYSEGFVKRGLFGTTALLIEKKFAFQFENTFNIFFIVFYSINIIAYFLLLKQYSQFKIIFVFLALSPTLILFSFNDLGGFQRFDVISIFLILFHVYLINLYRSNKISFENYRKKFVLFILPIFFISILIHEIQCWSIPFHFLLIKNIYDEKNYKNKDIFIYFSILILLTIFVFFFPINQENIDLMINKLSDRNLWIDAITVASSSEGNINVINYEIKTNLLNTYNLKINLLFLILGIVPINLLLLFLDKKKVIFVTKNTYLYMYISVIPYLSFFAIGDTGRWLHIISIICFGYLGQYPINNIKYRQAARSPSLIKK